MFKAKIVYEMCIGGETHKNKTNKTTQSNYTTFIFTLAANTTRVKAFASAIPFNIL